MALKEAMDGENNIKEPEEGFLKARHGITMLGKTAEGTCQECGRAHREDYPHDQQSLVYQYKFYDKHGRWPTWADAMAHCTDEMKAFWTEALQERGIKVEQ